MAQDHKVEVLAGTALPLSSRSLETATAWKRLSRIHLQVSRSGSSRLKHSRWEGKGMADPQSA